MKSPSYRKLTRDAKKTANQMAKAKKPAKVKSPGKTLAKIATAAGPVVMAGAIALTEHQKRAKKNQVVNNPDGTPFSPRYRDQPFRKNKKR